jgi:hypothetical protein
VAGIILGGRGRVAKQKVSHKRAQRDGHHDPAIVGHEYQHEHKGVKVLHGVQDGLDDVGVAAGFLLGASCPEEGRRLSSRFIRGVREVLEALCHGTLVPPACLTQSLVAGAEGDDDEQGEDKAGGGANVPPLEHDAQVGRIPCKEHTHAAHVVHAAVAVVHVAVIHIGVEITLADDGVHKR